MLLALVVHLFLYMSGKVEKTGKKENYIPHVTRKEKNTPIEEVPRTNTGVKIDHPEEMEEED